eukprot:TRINITY_DN7599_c2_g1_i1.p1 TRINITY_DN7599_c2_g1~~TRINITY_DN7599_c2_g1_i1.p1  ORF type:complete len:128 (-),score=21.76 TRINITY_DN7599_c2_g1_i1:63-446(-)
MMSRGYFLHSLVLLIVVCPSVCIVNELPAGTKSYSKAPSRGISHNDLKVSKALEVVSGKATKHLSTSIQDAIRAEVKHAAVKAKIRIETRKAQKAKTTTEAKKTVRSGSIRLMTASWSVLLLLMSLF